jgi:hypothetical protein
MLHGATKTLPISNEDTAEVPRIKDAAEVARLLSGNVPECLLRVMSIVDLNPRTQEHGNMDTTKDRTAVSIAVAEYMAFVQSKDFYWGPMPTEDGGTIEIYPGDHITMPTSSTDKGYREDLQFKHHALYIGCGLVVHVRGDNSIGVDGLFEYLDDYKDHDYAPHLYIHVRTYGIPTYSREDRIQRALQSVGRLQYFTPTHNCEHFVCWVCTGVYKSNQVGLKMAAIVLKTALKRVTGAGVSRFFYKKQ